eukprot:2200767-Pyramimonas_sp.AAC.1
MSYNGWVDPKGVEINLAHTGSKALRACINQDIQAAEHMTWHGAPFLDYAKSAWQELRGKGDVVADDL